MLSLQMCIKHVISTVQLTVKCTITLLVLQLICYKQVTCPKQLTSKVYK